MDYLIVATPGDGENQNWTVECIEQVSGVPVSLTWSAGPNAGEYSAPAALQDCAEYQLTAQAVDGQSVSVVLIEVPTIIFPLGAEWPLAAASAAGGQSDDTYTFLTGGC